MKTKAGAEHFHPKIEGILRRLEDPSPIDKIMACGVALAFLTGAFVHEIRVKVREDGKEKARVERIEEAITRRDTNAVRTGVLEMISNSVAYTEYRGSAGLILAKRFGDPKLIKEAEAEQQKKDLKR